MPRPECKRSALTTDETGVEILLHGFDAVVEYLAPHDVEDFSGLHYRRSTKLGGLGPSSHPGDAVLDLVKLEK